MNNRSNVAAVIAYLFSWVGWIIALCVGDRTDPFTLHHLNQALVLQILSTAAGFITVIPVFGDIIGGLAGIAVLVLTIIGIIRAATWSMEPLPFIGDIRIIS